MSTANKNAPAAAKNAPAAAPVESAQVSAAADELPPAAATGPNLEHPKVKELVEKSLAAAAKEIADLKTALAAARAEAAELSAKTEKQFNAETVIEGLKQQVELLKKQAVRTEVIGESEDPEVLELAAEKRRAGMSKEDSLDVARRQVALNRKKLAEAKKS